MRLDRDRAERVAHIDDRRTEQHDEQNRHEEEDHHHGQICRAAAAFFPRAGGAPFRKLRLVAPEARPEFAAMKHRLLEKACEINAFIDREALAKPVERRVIWQT